MGPLDAPQWAIQPDWWARRRTFGERTSRSSSCPWVQVRGRDRFYRRHNADGPLGDDAGRVLPAVLVCQGVWSCGVRGQPRVLAQIGGRGQSHEGQGRRHRLPPRSARASSAPGPSDTSSISVSIALTIKGPIVFSFLTVCQRATSRHHSCLSQVYVAYVSTGSRVRSQWLPGSWAAYPPICGRDRW